MARIIELIFTKERVWLWTDSDPVRNKYQLFTKDWQLIVEHDPEKMEWFNVWLEKLQTYDL